VQRWKLIACKFIMHASKNIFKSTTIIYRISVSMNFISVNIKVIDVNIPTRILVSFHFELYLDIFMCIFPHTMAVVRKTMMCMYTIIFHVSVFLATTTTKRVFDNSC
jgi:hypothetical protein